MSMFKVKCANPKCPYGKEGEAKDVFAYANSRMGTVPTQYCSNFCKKEAQYDKRFSKRA